MTKTVYQLIAEVSAEIAKTGISKDRNNTQQGYKFRGIDDVYNSLAPIISKSGLVIMPRIISREVTERSTAKGSTIFNVVVDAEFDFISSHDGSKHTAKTYGEAMDSADKATNKAMSAAYKYVVLQTFCVPTEGDNDADQTTHNIKSKDQNNGENKLTEKLPDYPTDKFEQNKNAWKLAIEAGRHTADSIINMISTKHALSNDQINSINQWRK